MADLIHIRNFCIIAHIDHGKSTLADRLLELTHTVAAREMRNQVLDQLDIERERGITVKLAPVRMKWKDYELNLIDTPGHVDFSYEVSRSLAAVEGALLVVDASQGIQAQTLANLELAKRQGLTVIPIINKIDLPNIELDTITNELTHLLSCRAADILRVSAKDGTGIEHVIDRIINDIPPPPGKLEAPLRALIFDSIYDPYQGVVVYVRLVDGRVTSGQDLVLTMTKSNTSALAVGMFTPKLIPTNNLQAGEIGYIVTGLKTVRQARVGDTITTPGHQITPLPGYREIQPMVFAGFFPAEGASYEHLREAMDKLRLNDAAVQTEPEHSPALGSGLRCGFLGLLHLDIVRERLQREYQLPVIITVPSVAYHVYINSPSPDLVVVRSPLELPDQSKVIRIEEPIMNIRIVTPADRLGGVLETLQKRRGRLTNIEYLDQYRAVVHGSMPLASMLTDFYDTLKSVSAGYASINYELSGYQSTDVIRLDIIVAGEAVESLASIVYRDESYRVGRQIVESLKTVLPRQQFEVKIQAAIGGTIIAAERIPPLRKDVTAKLYGGDVTRKRKLLEKQKKGKRRMKTLGRVAIPQSAYFAVLKR